METTEKKSITVATTINAPVKKVWEFWSEPKHIIQWNQASEDWHSPHAENDLRVDGKFKTTMAAKDGSFGFDFEGVYSEVEKFKKIAYSMSDGRKVAIAFSQEGNKTKVVETFDAEETNSHDMQKQGWQAILDSFKRHTEAN